jgi:NADH:ubiquinone oxidoreductase subunit 5 (subunit L)/multisubunit Na+/H+ antiporter MnhA subunit
VASNTKSRIPGGAIIVAALLVFVILIIATRILWPEFIGAVTQTTTTTQHTSSRAEDRVREVHTTIKRQNVTFWHIVGSILIPITGGLLIGWAGFKFNQRPRERDEAVENQQAQDNAIQAYLDQMSDLLVDRHLRSLPKGSDIHRLAEAKTVEVLLGLDSERKRRPLKLVYGLGLIMNRLHTAERDGALLDLENLSLNNPDTGERDGLY